MNELKPCPFCGSEAEVDSIYNSDVSCSNVGCIAWAWSKSVAVWNHRPIEDALHTSIAAFRARFDIWILSQDEGTKLATALAFGKEYEALRQLVEVTNV